MNRIWWWLVEITSQALEPHERDAVCGDLAESGETAGVALRAMLGLVARRQAALWKDWRPWAVLILLTLPLGILLSVAARITTSLSATYGWLYVNNWDWALLRYAEFWYELRDSLAFVFVGCFSLACWSWTAGFVLGSVSRRLILANGVLFCLTLFLGGLLAAPGYLAYVFQDVPSPNSSNPVAALAVYRNVVPLILQVALAAAPFIWAMRKGADSRRLPALLRTLVWAAAIVTLLGVVIRDPGSGFWPGTYRHPAFWHILRRASQFIVCWPAVYLISDAIGHRWRRMHA